MVPISVLRRPKRNGGLFPRFSSFYDVAQEIEVSRHFRKTARAGSVKVLYVSLFEPTKLLHISIDNRSATRRLTELVHANIFVWMLLCGILFVPFRLSLIVGPLIQYNCPILILKLFFGIYIAMVFIASEHLLVP